MSQKKNKKIGVFGGSFNPPHLGHFLIAKKVLKKFKLNQIIFIPTGIQPLKPVEQLAKSEDRYRMTQLMVKKDKHFIVSDIEIREGREGKKSYTVDTITKLKKKYPRTDLYLIIGEDSLKEILQGKWKKGFVLFAKVQFIVITRKGYQPNYHQLRKTKLLKKIEFLKIHSPISSTDIRRRIKKGQSIKKLVLKEVLNYIIKKKLYRFFK